MERDVHFGTVSPGPYAELIDAFVEERRKEAMEEPNQERRLGQLAGLQACEDMRDGDILDFDLALLVMRGVRDNSFSQLPVRGSSHEEYTRHKVATVEVAICYDILKAAYYKLSGEVYGDALDREFAERTGRYYHPARIAEPNMARHDDFAALASARRQS